MAAEARRQRIDPFEFETTTAQIEKLSLIQLEKKNIKAIYRIQHV